MVEKICKDCKYSVKDEYGFQRYEGNRYYCSATQERKVDPVTGEAHTIKTHLCYDMRSTDGACGPEGKLWEPRLALATKVA